MGEQEAHETHQSTHEDLKEREEDPNLLLGKIEQIENTYALVLTKFGRINTLNLPTRLYPCTVSNDNIELDYTTELAFSAACKKQTRFNQSNIYYVRIHKRKRQRLSLSRTLPT